MLSGVRISLQSGNIKRKKFELHVRFVSPPVLFGAFHCFVSVALSPSTSLPGRASLNSPGLPWRHESQPLSPIFEGTYPGIDASPP
jgi:hypothetical protein